VSDGEGGRVVERKCPDCYGSGHLGVFPGTYRHCSVCHGTGIVAERVEPEPPKELWFVVQDSPAELTPVRCLNADHPEGYHAETFPTREAAEEFVRKNRPRSRAEVDLADKLDRLASVAGLISELVSESNSVGTTLSEAARLLRGQK
jgi:hypothetical protein